MYIRLFNMLIGPPRFGILILLTFRKSDSCHFFLVLVKATLKSRLSIQLFLYLCYMEHKVENLLHNYHPDFFTSFALRDSNRYMGFIGFMVYKILQIQK